MYVPAQQLLFYVGILRHFWLAYYTKTLPRFTGTWSCEHVVPRSMLRGLNQIADDPHNLVIFPTKLNNARSSLKYVPAYCHDKFKCVCPCDPKCANKCVACGHVSKTGFTPPDLWKGQIARAALNMVKEYPQLEQGVFDRVIDKHVAEQWNSSYPATMAELEWSKIVNVYNNKVRSATFLNRTQPSHCKKCHHLVKRST